MSILVPKYSLNFSCRIILNYNVRGHSSTQGLLSGDNIPVHLQYLPVVLFKKIVAISSFQGLSYSCSWISP